MLNLEQLAQFLAVAECLNFTKAAERLFISHSTISRNIAALEEQLGVQLFVRDKHRVRMTACGEALADRARRLLESVELMIQDVRRAGMHGKIPLVIASFSFYCKEMYRCYRIFGRECREYELVIRHGAPDRILPMLEEKNADIGVSFSFVLEERDTQDYEIYPVQEGEFYAIVSSEHPLAQREQVDVRDPGLFANGVIMLERLDYRFVQALGSETAHIPEKRLMVPSLESLIMQVKAGNEVALLPQHVAEEAGPGCARLRLIGVDSSYQIIMFQSRDNRNPAAEAFLDIYRREYACEDVASV